MLCPICNRTIASGDFCDDLQCPNPTRDAAEGAGVTQTQRAAMTLARSAAAAPPKPAPDAMREAIQSVIDEMIAVAVQEDDGNIPEWTSENQAEVDKWQVRLADAIALSSPVPPADGAGECALETSRLEYEGWTQASVVSGYWIKALPDNAVVSVMNGDLRKLEEATHEIVERSPPGTGAAEPVARRWRYSAGSDSAWRLCDVPIAHKTIIVEPLYATPPVRGDRETIEAVADAIDAARYEHPEHPRARPRPFAEADRSDREYATRLAKAAILSLPVQPGAGEREALNDSVAVSAKWETRFNEVEHQLQSAVQTLHHADEFLDRLGIFEDNHVRKAIRALSRQAPPSSSEGGR